MEDNIKIKEMPSRFKHRISKYKIVRSDKCINCGLCARLCPYGVFERREGYNKSNPPISYRCIGFECKNNEFYCINKCPQKALSLELDPMYEALGDFRWTPDIIVGTWIMAETGHPPKRKDLEYNVGNSGGGFDKLRFKFPKKSEVEKVDKEEISLSVELNRRNDNRPKIEIGIPMYGGGMSFGSIGLSTMVSRAKNAKFWNSFVCTGEGGYPPELYPYDDHIITQVATGLFGVREETIKRVRIVEFKYAQGAKPGLGGHLLGEKVTDAVAKMRESVKGVSLFSPFPFHSVYSIEDHKKHVDWIKEINQNALVSVKVSTPNDVDMVAVGSYYAGAHIIHLDGSYGGTGAAPDIAKKNIAMPIEYAIPKVHKFLTNEGVRDKITVAASGGIRTAHDIAKAICLGADCVVIGTADLVALECVRCGNCESGRGCPRGIATTDPELSNQFDVNYGTQRLINFYNALCEQLKDILAKFGMKSIKELVGRTDLLYHVDYSKEYLLAKRL
ncbi:MAG: glutamate synthase-related protein [Candidatus Altarchaeaceae archaeon]